MATDPPLDPRAWWPDWQPTPPEMTIACDCGASVTLAAPLNVCHCGRRWNQWGRRVYPRPENRGPRGRSTFRP
jgi:hypothetical protein